MTPAADQVQACPCGAGTPFAEHCGPVLDGTPAATAEALMRSRYTAYALLQQGDQRAADHLWRTWHPRTRPEVVEPGPGLRWVGLEVTQTRAGGPQDDPGVVAFVARWTTGEGEHRPDGELVERSDFARRGGRWVYVGALAEQA